MNFPLSTLHFPFVRRSCRTGFTLIEILVATTILLVIVILASLVFQQTTGAYHTGERKVNAQVALRNVVGAMTRDLALAVDSRDYPSANSSVKNDFRSKSMSFVALSGTPGKDAKGKENQNARTARFITYSSNGKRTEKIMTCGRGGDGQPNWSVVDGGSADSDLYEDDPNDDLGNFNLVFDYDWPEDPDAKLPERVFIRVAIEGSGETTVVGVGSGGRRGWGSADEIWVGVKPN